MCRNQDIPEREATFALLPKEATETLCHSHECTDTDVSNTDNKYDGTRIGRADVRSLSVSPASSTNVAMSLPHRAPTNTPEISDEGHEAIQRDVADEFIFSELSTMVTSLRKVSELSLLQRYHLAQQHHRATYQSFLYGAARDFIEKYDNIGKLACDRSSSLSLQDIPSARHVAGVEMLMDLDKAQHNYFECMRIEDKGYCLQIDRLQYLENEAEQICGKEERLYSKNKGLTQLFATMLYSIVDCTSSS